VPALTLSGFASFQALRRALRAANRAGSDFNFVQYLLVYSSVVAMRRNIAFANHAINN
jgi:hypothetical protein